MKSIFFGAGSDLGVHIDGSNLAPRTIIKKLCRFNNEFYLLEKNANIIKSKNKNDLRKNEKEIMNFNKKLYNTICEKSKNFFPILIGGDHSVSIASALASCKKNGKIGIIWIDAHPDYNTYETTITGNIHGLPLAAITGYKCNELTSFHNGVTIDPKNCVIVGARSIDELEKENLHNAGGTIFTTQDLKSNGIQQIMKKAFEIASYNTNGIHISYDLDVIDPKEAPGVSVPEDNGITKKEALEIAYIITNNKKNIVSFDLVEFNPTKDINQKTEKIALEILTKIKDI